MSEYETNPLLTNFTAPGETFRLPSGGIFYDETVLDPSVKNGEVYVRPMTAYDEVLLKTPDKLFSGDAVREVFSHCIPSILQPGELFAKDVDFLLVCLRKVSYGEEMQISFTHDCENAQEHSYVININEFIKNSKEIDPTTSISNYTVDLDNGQQVVISPIKFDDYIDMMQLTENYDSTDPYSLQEIMIRSVLNIISSVDGYTDKQIIKEWLEQIPPKHTKKINNNVDKTLEWGPDFTVTETCKDCGQNMEVTAPMNPLAFFT